VKGCRQGSLVSLSRKRVACSWLDTGVPEWDNATWKIRNRGFIEGNNMSRGTTPQNPPDSPEYVEKWARELIAAAGKRQARTILGDYRALAENPRLAKYDRDVAEQRARILSGLL
jgi:hypothetical protein